MSKVYIVVNECERYTNTFAGFSTTLEGARNIIKAWYEEQKYICSQWDEKYYKISIFTDVPYYYICTEPFQEGWMIFVYDTDKPISYLYKGWKNQRQVPSI